MTAQTIQIAIHLWLKCRLSIQKVCSTSISIVIKIKLPITLQGTEISAVKSVEKLKTRRTSFQLFIVHVYEAE